MSYNTRRSGGFGSSPQQPQQQNVGVVGQRRPVVTNNFVPGGQLNPQQQQPQKVQNQAQTPQQRPVAPQQQTSVNFRNQQQPQQQTQPQNYQSQGYSTNAQQAAYQPQIKTEPLPRQPPQVQPPQVKAQPAANVPTLPGANPPPPENDAAPQSMETNEDGTPKKKTWFKGKISKAEKVRRRNMRLSKILQPKNAVMILNELVKGCQYTCDELPCKVDANQFRASVAFEDQEFAGTGRTKNLAKNAAAETALKHLVKNKQLTLKKEEDADGDEKMEIPEDGTTNIMPWSHIASFAMYKLFSGWGEDPSLTNRAQELMGVIPKMPGTPGQALPNPKPAKKMPDNPEKMNPLMLINQMLPQAQWEEVGKSGTPPNLLFTFRVVVDGENFTGTGPNKKAAKKLAAFSACHQILKIAYPPEVWVPLY